MLGAIIQARLGSKRLPGKNMIDIAGRPMLGHVIDKAKVFDTVIVATPDEEIAKYARDQGVTSFIGSENDVLDRYYQAAIAFGLQHIVRLTADNPLVRPETIEKVVWFYMLNTYDWVGNCRLKTTYPIGDDVEVFTFGALEKAWREDTKDREHVTPYIYNHPELFHLGIIENEIDESHIRWTVDTKEDLEFVRSCYGRR